MAKRPPPEILLAAALVITAGLYAAHQRATARAETEIAARRDACLAILKPDQPPENQAQLTCRALYRQLGIAKPLPKPL